MSSKNSVSSKNLVPYETTLLVKDCCLCLHVQRVARTLAERGIPSAVIRGGLSAWKKASLPLEAVPASDVVMLPKFA